MCKQGKQVYFKIFVGILILILAGSASYSRVVGNWSDCGLEPGCDGSEKISGSGVGLGFYVVRAAGHFLNSHSAWNTFLCCVEMSELNGVDFNELREGLYTAIEEMEKANFIYSELTAAAKKSAYVRSVIDCLAAFDYETFRREKGLNAVIFKKVKKILVRGDILRVYKKARKKTGVILRQLYIVKDAIDADTFPEIEGLWQINQEYAEYGLFGQYVSQVFYAVLHTR